MRFEEANRRHRDLDALRVLSIRERRLRQAVTENNLVIVTGAGASRMAYVVLCGRVALTIGLREPHAAEEVRRFIAANYDRYRVKPLTRDELEPMTIVSRWLREREYDEGQLVFLNGPYLPSEALASASASLGRYGPFRNTNCPSSGSRSRSHRETIVIGSTSSRVIGLTR